MSFRKPFRAVPIKLGKRYRANARRKRLLRNATPIAILMGAAAIGGVVGIASTVAPSAPAAAGEIVSGCRATDGDTIRCGDERIRLLAIDAPELPGHCRSGRKCAPGDPVASTDSLGMAMTGALRINRVGTDHYGRTLATMTGDRGDLSCWQLSREQAIYRSDWDNGLRVARTCPADLFG
jgi:endonuclease YncB( thermonuclease family)